MSSDPSYLHCPAGSHMAMCDDQQTYLFGLVDFLTSDQSLPSSQGDVR